METSNPGIPILIALVVILLSASIGSYLARKIKQPAVLGELMAGVFLGNLALFGFDIFEYFAENSAIDILARIGVIVLLFQVGLETKITDMLKLGKQSLMIGFTGVILPFVFGYFAADLLIPGLNALSKFFIGGILTATSVGVTVRVFQDLGKIESLEAKLVLGSAIIDDLLGLIILAVLVGVAQTGHVSWFEISKTSLIAIAFICLAIFLSLRLPNKAYKEPGLFKEHGSILTFALILCFLGAIVAELIGLAAIIGAFTVGVVLEGISFKDSSGALKIFPIKHQIQEYVAPIARFFVPIFFVITGMHVDLRVFFDLPVIVVALIIAIVAVLGKLISAWSFNYEGKINRWLVGFGMVPRGEVGLIFAALGKDLGVVSEELYVVGVIVVILTTFIAPPLLDWVIRRSS